MHKMKKIFLLFALQLMTLSAFAVMADPTPFMMQLEDGSWIQVRQYGDEFHSYITDMEGNLIRGQFPTKGKTEEIRQRRQIRQKQMLGGFPLNGTPHSLVILLEFKDVKFQTTRQAFYNLLNQSGYSDNNATGSCRDYFIACSDSLFQPEFDVYGPYTLSKDVAYYGEQKGDIHDTNAFDAFVEAVQLANEDIDFSQYDTNGDGKVDNIFFYYAGHNQAEGASENTIWPHSSNLQSRDIVLDGKQITTYACTSELKGSGGTVMCGIGTFCHEFSHVLGLPDWYDTSYGQYTVGSWSIMASGNYNNYGHTPPTYSSYERFYLGWLKPEQLKRPGAYAMQSLQETNSAYLIAASEHNLMGKSPSPNEFFMIEYRTQVGWDAYLPGQGMLVWHIDYSAGAWADNTPNNSNPMRMHLEEAGGRKTDSSASDAYPGTRGVTSFIPKLHNNTLLSDQTIYNITDKGNLLEFVYVQPGDGVLSASPSELHIEAQLNDNNKPENWKSYAIRLVGEQLRAGEVVTVEVPRTGNFYITNNTEAINKRTSPYWMRSLTLKDTVDAEGKLDATFYVSYNPQKRKCELETALITVKTETSMLSIPLSGISTRPTYVTTPRLNEAKNITPYSFEIDWKAVNDAEAYFLHLYTSQEGTTDFVQDFENFDNAGAIAEAGWQSTTTTTTTAAKKDGVRSMLYKNTGDMITSPFYPIAITQISFWANAYAADVDTMGILVLEGSQNGKKWLTRDTFYVTSDTKRKTFTKDFAVSDELIQFRLSYVDFGGKGTAVDAFTARCNEKIEYIYQGRELKVPNTELSYVFTELTPNTRYSYQLQATDGYKGCEEHITTPSKVKSIVTLPGEAIDSPNLTIGIDASHMTYNQDIHVIYLPNSIEDATLYVYDLYGKLVWSQAISEGQAMVELPPYAFTPGNIYIAKYTSSKKIARKDKWVKFLY